MLVDEQVRLSLPCQAQHRVVEVLDPAAHSFSIAQFDGNDHLAIAERAQIECLLAGITRRRRLGTAARRERRGHDSILDAMREAKAAWIKNQLAIRPNLETLLRKSPETFELVQVITTNARISEVRNLPIILTAGIVVAQVLGQSRVGAPKGVTLTNEPHHSLVLENDEVRVFRLILGPNESTLPHHHEGPYAYVSVRTARIENVVRGHAPVLVELAPGEVHTSKGGFTVAEENDSTERTDLVVVVPRKTASAGFDSPMGGLVYHDAAFAELFSESMMRGYSIAIAAGGKFERHQEKFDRLLIAVSDLDILETEDGGRQVGIQMKSGEVRWLPRGTTHNVTNVGQSPAAFVILEFN